MKDTGHGHTQESETQQRSGEKTNHTEQDNPSLTGPSEVASQPRPITYPEFAPREPAGSPLLSLRRLLLLVYLSAGAASVAYILSKVAYRPGHPLTFQIILQPMLARLVTSRKDFCEHALQQISMLNDRLSGIPLTKLFSPSRRDEGG